MNRYGKIASAVALCAAFMFGGAGCKQHSQPGARNRDVMPEQNNQRKIEAGAQSKPQPKTTEPLPMGITRSDFGKTKEGQPVELYTLRNGKITAKITNYGGIITEIDVPDKSGKTADVVLGFNNLDQYLAGHPFFGAIAGRYANRIAKGTFVLDGDEHTLAINNGPNSLHGGNVGFDKAVWKAQSLASEDGPALKLTHVSGDGDEGYPGMLNVSCTYTITKDSALKIDFEATTDQPTVVNLTNHSYWNLGGESSGSILEHVLTLNASSYTPVDSTQIPTGEIKSVRGTPMDFTAPHPVGERLAQVPGGYDHNYVIDGGGTGKLVLAGKLKDPKTGRAMELYTTQPGVQLYTSNFLDGKLKGPGGRSYQAHDALCLETQHFPDSPNHPEFPSTVLRPGEKYHQVTVYKFLAE